MQSYKNLKADTSFVSKTAICESVVRETVPTNDSKHENRFFFLTLLVVIGLAGMLLWLSNQDTAAEKSLPNHLSNIATQLSIAIDEIMMLQDIGVISAAPSLSELLSNQLEPFISETVIEAGSNCFVITKAQAILRLIKLPEQSWQVQWFAGSEQHQHPHQHQQQYQHQSEDLLAQQADLCSADDGWLSATHPTDKN